jgi:hypothetical protein
MSSAVTAPPSASVATVAITDRAQIRELAAQETMADMAVLMVIATAISVILTGIGIYFVKRTLDASWKAVAASNDATEAARTAVTETTRIGEAQARAYLDAYSNGLFFDDTRTGNLAGRATNTGMTPALEVSIAATGSIKLDEEPIWALNFYEKEARAFRQVPAQQHRIISLSVGEFPADLRAKVAERRVSCEVTFKYQFKDVFGITVAKERKYHSVGRFENGSHIWFEFPR